LPSVWRRGSPLASRVRRSYRSWLAVMLPPGLLTRRATALTAGAPGGRSVWGGGGVGGRSGGAAPAGEMGALRGGGAGPGGVGCGCRGGRGEEVQAEAGGAEEGEVEEEGEQEGAAERGGPARRGGWGGVTHGGLRGAWGQDTRRRGRGEAATELPRRRGRRL